MFFLRLAGSLSVSLLLAATLPADPLSKSHRIDFYRDTVSRDLHGMATRSDGRLLSGPTVRTLDTALGTNLLWGMVSDGDKLLVGTGPDGKVLSLTPGPEGKVTTHIALDLPESHVFTVRRLPNGDLLAGTSPQGTIVLARQGEVIARVALPVDSILDFCMPADDAESTYVLVATGNPGRIYLVDLTKLAAAGDHPEKVTMASDLAAKGITLWGSVRDDNLRRLISLPDGRIIAGSAPKGNVYAFPATGGAPMVLDENSNAEVTDLLPWDGGFYAAITFTSEPGQNRVKRHNNTGKTDAEKSTESETDTAVLVMNTLPTTQRFRGRSQLVWFPDGGFPEVVTARNNTAFYRLQAHAGQILITGGEEGELLGYDPGHRRNLTYPGMVTAQVNGIVPASGLPDTYYLVGNNPAALALVNFDQTSIPRAETRRIDLGTPARIGALRFNRPPSYPAEQLDVELRASFSSDELEGWSPWQQAAYARGGWTVPGLRGRYVQLRLSAKDTPFELSAAKIYYLPQNRRPQLANFRVLAPNFAIIPAVKRTDNISTSLAQILQSNGKDDNDRSNFLSSQIVPQTGTQVVFWTVNDPDDDNVVTSFSLRHEDDEQWTDLAVDTSEPYAQFEISHLREGLYHTRLVATESAPRPRAERLRITFETDDFLIDRTPPQIVSPKAAIRGNYLRVSIIAKDALSLLAGMEVNLNNGFKRTVDQPLDGILDGQQETFTVEIPVAQISGSTSLEMIVYDDLGNNAAVRLAMPTQ